MRREHGEATGDRAETVGSSATSVQNKKSDESSSDESSDSDDGYHEGQFEEAPKNDDTQVKVKGKKKSGKKDAKDAEKFEFSVALGQKKKHHHKHHHHKIHNLLE